MVGQDETSHGRPGFTFASPGQVSFLFVISK